MSQFIQRTLLTLTGLLIAFAVWSQGDSTQVNPLSKFPSYCIVPIVYEGDSGIFFPTPCDTKIRYVLEYSIANTERSIHAQEALWTSEIVSESRKDKNEALKEENALLKRQKEDLIEDSNLDEAMIRSQSDAIEGLESQNKTLRKLGFGGLLVGFLFGVLVNI